ncbi:MAG: DUF1178 family protein [Alphaproteobacteria bacterium]|nr:DUF1178 family protein [Alphaproteobacteria bacterium]
MILYDLQCKKGHVFEAWFRDSQTYEAQVGAKKVVCPVCGSKKIEKAPMAPRLGRSTKKGAAEAEPAPPAPVPAPPAPSPEAVRYMQALASLRKHVEANCDYVGPKFPEEARKIHYGETEARNIYGEATPDEAAKLADEGVEFQPVPWVRRDDA